MHAQRLERLSASVTTARLLNQVQVAIGAHALVLWVQRAVDQAGVSPCSPGYATCSHLWTFLVTSLKALPAAARAALEHAHDEVCFLGVGGNNEDEFMPIAGFLVEKMGRFGRFAERGDLNAHMPGRRLIVCDQ